MVERSRLSNFISKSVQNDPVAATNIIYAVHNSKNLTIEDTKLGRHYANTADFLNKKKETDP